MRGTGRKCTEVRRARRFDILRSPASVPQASAGVPKLSSRRHPLIVPVVLLVVALASGCQSGGKEFDMRGSPERIYSDAQRDIAGGNYAEGIRKLELLEARFPFSDPAKQGQLDLMYAYYKNRESESAIDQADQFIRENPTHPRADYAYYIRGLVHFEAGANWLERVFRADMTKRPPQEARQSLQSFQTLVQSYPKSPYAADARQRIVYLRNRLADYELAVARYYMKRGAYVGALNRARNLIESYDGAPAALEALKLGAEAYRRLGMDDLAAVAQAIYLDNANAPDLMAMPAGGTASAGMAMSAETQGGTAPPPPPVRAGRWEASVGAGLASSSDVDFEGGTSAEIDSGVGFLLGVGYHFNERLKFGATFGYDQKDYEVEVAGDEPGESFTGKGSLDSTSLMVDVIYNFLTGPFTPYVAGGVGWSWVDTNIATEPPEIGCWWHPWYGYVCTSFQDTRTVDGLAYELGVGMRYDFGNALAAEGAYTMRWVDFENATGTPSFDGVQLNLIWKF
jgi:outer membrane protein assembly factor BamD